MRHDDSFIILLLNSLQDPSTRSKSYAAEDPIEQH